MNASVDVISLKKKLLDCRLERINELARVSGISQPTLRKILAGHAQPSSPVIMRLSIVLSLSPEETGKIFFRNNLGDVAGVRKGDFNG